MAGCLAVARTRDSSRMAGYLAVLSRTHVAMTKRKHSSATAGERMRIAIVGGGCAGLTSALHLAPLVEKGLVAAPIDVYEGGPPHGRAFPCGTGAVGRDIGVGIWSTALKPLRDRASLDFAWENLTRAGRWVGEVGYRTPNGTWLSRSVLPSSADDDLPGLLFLREKDLLMALREAVHLEERAGTIKIHWDKSGDSTHAKGIWKDAKRFSAPLSLDQDTPSERDYHLIVAADGMLSTLRLTYGGRRKGVRLTGTSALPNPFGEQQAGGASDSLSWESGGQETANAIEDRKYTVYRGNADMTIEETGLDGTSFQTWGVGKSMRFATVPICYGSGSERVEKQVWFVTTSDDSIASQPDPGRRHEMLLSSFAKWHHPIPQLLQATPPEEILMERAVAHKYSMGPVLDVNRILSQMYSQSSSGPGPALVFIGDSYMTVDPILAQGFTMAMESAYELGRTVESSLVPSADEPALAFDPAKLRASLRKRHDRREQRLLCLLRATELVQGLGQPDSRTVSGLLSRGVVRPLMQVSPDFVKRPIFDSMLKYSLGIH